MGLVEYLTKLTRLKNGSFRAERNTERYNYYEKYLIEYNYKNIEVQVETFIQGLPQTVPVSLERYIEIVYVFKTAIPIFFTIQERTPLDSMKSLFISSIKLHDGEFNKRFILRGTPQPSIKAIFNTDAVRKIMLIDEGVIGRLAVSRNSPASILTFRLCYIPTSMQHILTFIEFSEYLLDRVIISSTEKIIDIDRQT